MHVICIYQFNSNLPLINTHEMNRESSVFIHHSRLGQHSLKMRPSMQHQTSSLQKQKARGKLQKGESACRSLLSAHDTFWECEQSPDSANPVLGNISVGYNRVWRLKYRLGNQKDLFQILPLPHTSYIILGKSLKVSNFQFHL